MSIDKIGFAQMILFGFPFGRRTLIKGKSFPDVLPKHLDYLIQKENSTNYEQTPSLSEILKKCISEGLSGLRNPVVFMSAGYDSRLILAGILSSGFKPDLVTYFNRSTSSELEIVRQIAEECNLVFIPCEDKNIEIGELERHLSTYLRDSFFVSNPVRLMYYSQSINANIKSDGLFSGEGETFRFPGFPSEYLTRGALAAIKREKVSIPTDCIFIDLPWVEAIQEVEDHLSEWDSIAGEMQRIYKWLTEQAYPKIYGSMAMAFGSIAQVNLPLLKPEFMKAVAASELGILNHSKMKSSVWDLWKSKKVYSDILKELYPQLLNIPTDRGYKPINDINAFSYFGSNLIRRIKKNFAGEKRSFSASKGALSYSKFLYEKLQNELQYLPFTNSSLVKLLLNERDGLDGSTIHSLSQVLILSEMLRSGHL